MIADLLAHDRSGSGADTIVVDLTTAAREHIAAWTALFGRAGRTIVAGGTDHVRALASQGTVGQVLDVLLDNALRHGAGTVTVTVRQDARFATLTVADEGPGIAAPAAEHVFERGATGAGGTGIGLHLARTLARADRGGLRLVNSAPPCFELRLRRPGPAPAA
jgi:signal transduction histidine kinase